MISTGQSLRLRFLTLNLTTAFLSAERSNVGDSVVVNLGTLDETRPSN